MSESDARELGHILVIEEDEDIARRLVEDLVLEGYRVDWRENGPEGLERAQDPSMDLVILDLSPSELDGFRVVRALRNRGCWVPVMVLSACGDESQKVLSLRTGADDYVVKPYGASELMARVGALLRRSRQLPPGGGDSPHPGTPTPATCPSEATISFNDVQVDPASRAVQKRGEEVKISPKEFELLLALARREGAAATREELLEEVWSPESRGTTRTVDTHVYELRRKLEDQPSNPRHLLTVRKWGYRLRRS